MIDPGVRNPARPSPKRGRPLPSGVFHAPEIAVAIAGLPPESGAGTPEAARWVRDRRIRGVALDAARPDCRARDLGRSARRDLAAMLRRTELELTGIDLFIPPAHYADPARAERAIETVQQTATMVAELARLVGGRSRPLVSVTLPAELPASVRAALAVHAERFGSTIADHTPRAEAAPPGLTLGVDPAACFMAGEDPAAAATRAGVSALRLTNLDATGRCAANADGGRLDATGYAAAAVTTGLRWIVADTRGVPEPGRAVSAAVATWREAAMLPDA